MSLIIHGAGYSPYTQRVLTTLLELGVDDWKLEFVDMMKGVHKSPEFLAIMQPFGQLPVLKDGDLTLFESRAIMRYLAEKFEGQGTALLGTTPKERALVNQWLEVESQNFNPAAASIAFEVVFAPVFGQQGNNEVVVQQVAKLEKVLDVYEAHLSKSKYLAGDAFTLADLSHLPYANVVVNAAGKGDLFTSRPHLNAWWKDVSARPTFQKVLGMNEFTKGQ